MAVGVGAAEQATSAIRAAASAQVGAFGTTTDETLVGLVGYGPVMAMGRTGEPVAPRIFSGRQTKANS
jgi:hypothetical protein